MQQANRDKRVPIAQKINAIVFFLVQLNIRYFVGCAHNYILVCSSYSQIEKQSSRELGAAEND